MLLVLLKTAALTFWRSEVENDTEYSFQRSRRSRTWVVVDWQISYAMNTALRSDREGKIEREGDHRWRTDWIWSSESMSCGGFSPAVRITSLCAATPHFILIHDVLTALGLALLHYVSFLQLCNAFWNTTNMFHMEGNYCAGKEPKRNCS